MFREALLESSPLPRQRKRWPMATAFMVELIVAGVLVVVPLISTGVIPLTAHTLVFTPPYAAPPPDRPSPPSGGGGGPSFRQTVAVNTNRHGLIDRDLPPQPGENPDPTMPPGIGPNGPPISLFTDVRPIPVKPPEEKKRIVISNPSEAMLLKKVVPEYPKIAILTGVQGDVKLHAIIAKDGTIQSLSVTSGHPMLIEAAKAAVQQWRYRPYKLNGEPVEVETIITVTFKRT